MMPAVQSAVRISVLLCKVRGRAFDVLYPHHITDRGYKKPHGLARIYYRKKICDVAIDTTSRRQQIRFLIRIHRIRNTPTWYFLSAADVYS